jgi:antitoxin (DNA-binding transcriptional repressor) of toxin-antitoxin stability system
MAAVVTVDQAQAKLRELIEALGPGQEVIITDKEQAVARLLPAAEVTHKPRQPGTLKGTVLYMAADFDAPLEDFRDYME